MMMNITIWKSPLNILSKINHKAEMRNAHELLVG